MAALVARLAEEYDVDPQTLERDVTSFLSELAEGGVIERMEASDVR